MRVTFYESALEVGATLFDMTIADLVSSIDSEIVILLNARRLLTDGSKPSGFNSSSKPNRRRRKLSAEARKRIADAQRKRWAEYKKRGAKQPDCFTNSASLAGTSSRGLMTRRKCPVTEALYILP
jgi:hypothetical protein